ncbi:hypothetical protein Scani_18410 [Streptomyces caniferus]|uniref:Uncharacterized protein n=1 Tax=Streptomyces caniferus TaxID=285557 RepID=A0A640S286_9ACTN|nr:hypothetical protein Scani_18410 [Streptomyces caniferus]
MCLRAHKASLGDEMAGLGCRDGRATWCRIGRADSGVLGEALCPGLMCGRCPVRVGEWARAGGVLVSSSQAEGSWGLGWFCGGVVWCSSAARPDCWVGIWRTHSMR